MRLAKGFERQRPDDEPLSGLGGGTGAAGELAVPEQQIGVFLLKRLAAQHALPCFQGVALIKGQPGPEEKREQPGRTVFLLQQTQCLVKKKVGGTRPFRTNAKGLQKSGAVGGHAQAGQIHAQAGQPLGQYAFMQGEVCAMP